MAVKPAKPGRKLVVIENSQLVNMANQKTFLREFPFLKSLAGLNPKSCRPCKGGTRNQRQITDAFASAKQTLAGMGDAKKRKLKQLLNARKVRLTYRMGSKVVQHNF